MIRSASSFRNVVARAILAVCLAALEAALARISIRAEVAIVINGSRRADYAGLIASYPGFEFIFVSRPLGLQRCHSNRVTTHYGRLDLPSEQ